MAPSTSWREDVKPDEDERFGRYAEELRAMQRARANGGAKDRALHAKSTSSVVATFEVLGDLPEHARVGLFAKPATYDALVRFSNGGAARESDKKPDVRGVAIKIFGVDGKKVIPGLEDKRTQDFLMIRTPSVPVRDADEFLALVRAAQSPALLPVKLAFAVGPVRAFQIVKRALPGLSAPMVSHATTDFFTALPLAFGPYAVKASLKARAPADASATAGEGRDYLADDLAARLAKGSITYDFRVQFFVDGERTPIEDASVEWKESDAPWITVARLVLPSQDVSSERGKKIAALVEKLSFDPWHARDDLRPLGNMMRARNHAYRASTEERAALGEPDTLEV